MGTLRNFLSFAVKSAFIVGFLSTTAVLFIGINEPQDSVVGVFAFILPYTAVTGLIAGSIGFWVMRAFRTLPATKFTIVSYFVAIALGASALAFFSRYFHLDSFRSLIFPVLPFVISVYLFTKLSQKHFQK